MTVPSRVPVSSAPAAGAPSLEPVHDFAGKLRQPALVGHVQRYVAWRREVAAAREAGAPPPPMPPIAPLSINLDLTTACNYACTHCVDWDILNTGVSFDESRLRRSVERMAAAGLRSVILIGGGEPTVHPGFVPFVGFLKDLALEVAVVTNGSRTDRLLACVDRLGPDDWIRLSLDSGTDATFQRMHRPKKPVTLEAICAGIRPIKERNPAPRVGFSYVIAWSGAEREAGAEVIDNVDEMPLAARLARDAGFDYVSFKPFLARTSEGAEAMDLHGATTGEPAVLDRIRARLEEARRVATPSFRVVESTNLRVLLDGTWRTLTKQPRTCHVQAFRQVLTPLGLYHCPAHRGAEKGLLAGKDVWASDRGAEAGAEATAASLERFDASVECREVTCLYHGANWWLEHAIAAEGDGALAPSPETRDWFL